MLIPVAYAQSAANAANQSQATFYALAMKGFLAIVLAAAFFIIAKVVASLVKKHIQKKVGDQHQETVILYSRVTFVGVFGLGLLVSLMVAGLPLELFSGALGLGLGLAMKDIMANFISGMILLSNEKFNIGDVIQVGAFTGTIVDIESRTTSLRGFDGEEITIPNSKMLMEDVVCFTKNPIRRREIAVQVSYDTDLEKAKGLALSVVKAHGICEPKPGPVAITESLGDSGINLKIHFWVAKGSDFVDAQSELTGGIVSAFRKEGIEIPFPTHTVITQNNAGVASHRKEQVISAIPQEG